MNPVIFQKIADIIKPTAEAGKAIAEDGSSEKYAQNVNTLYNGATHDEMREFIKNSTDFTDKEKWEMFKELDELEMASKKEHGDSIQRNREHAANTALKIVAGVLTAGMSVAVPEIAKTVSEKKAARLAQTADSLPPIDNAITLEPKEPADSEDE